MVFNPLAIVNEDPRCSPKSKLSILKIQRTCVHDGPGIRTVVFFRGCNMRCKWCHNPEAQAFSLPDHTSPSTSDVLDTIRRDREYYTSTHGGVTLSGGEPLLQRCASLVHLLQALKSEGISVAIETTADAPWKTIQACLPYVDLFLIDIKTAGDDEKYVRLTARRPQPVEDNIRRLIAARANVRFRMCVVPGINDDDQDIAAIASLLKSLGHPSIELLRYYNLHESKVKRLGVEQDALQINAAASAEALDRVAQAFASQGIDVKKPSTKIGTSPPPFSPRVNEIKRTIRASGHHVCIESACLKTSFYKENGFDDPVPIHRSRALRYVLTNKKVRVYPNELLVGNFTSKRVGGNVWMEYFGPTLLSHFWRLDHQKPVSFTCSAADKARFYAELLPFWLRHSLVSKVFSPKELARFGARAFDKRAGFNNNMAAIAHYIVNCERILSLGTSGIAKEVSAKLPSAEVNQTHFYRGVLIALRGLEEFAERYAQHLRSLAESEPSPSRRAELEAMAEVCSRVPKYPARTLHEALQSILFLQIALCTESFENAISLGRLDKFLYPFYAADVAAGRIDYEKAQELIACFVLKFDEIIFLNDGDSGLELGKMFESLSPVETVTVGGVDRDGNDITNDVTYMILDACELRPIGINMAARIHRNSPDRYVERIAEVYLNGSPMPALYNDEVYVAALRKQYGTSLADVRNYSIVGCVEPVASDDHFANTDCANINVVLPFLQALKGDTRRLWCNGVIDFGSELLFGPARKVLGKRKDWGGLLGKFGLAGYSPPENLDVLMDRFQSRLNDLVASILADHQAIEKVLGRDFHTPLASSLFEGCIKSGKDVYEGGATINTSGIQAVGVTDVADSLHAIEEVVYKKKLYSLEEVIRAIDADFEGEHNQGIRESLKAVPKFGNDESPVAHGWVNRVLQAYVDALQAAPHPSRNGKYVAGYYGLNVNRVYGKKAPSLPSGRLGGTPLANSICPHYGMQMVDLTSSLNSISGVDFATYAPNGTTLTSTIDGGLFPGEEGIRNLAGLIRGFFNRGGMQFQPNLVSRERLWEAYNNPGMHRDLVVRIAGYCAYFDDLSDDLKLEILNRTYYCA